MTRSTNGVSAGGRTEHESPPMRCLGFRWSVRADDAALVDRITELYDACRDPGPPEYRFVLTSGDSPDGARIDLRRDDRLLRTGASADLAVAHLAWEINRGVEEVEDRLLLHAAAAAEGEDAVVLCGAQDAGKSTLVASLVRAGLSYLTDEIVAVDRDEATIESYPKPIGLDAGVADLLPDVADVGIGRGDHLLVSPRRIRRSSIAPRRCVARMLVIVSRADSAGTALERITRADAAVEATRNSFNFRTFGPGRLDLLGRFVASCHCFRLEMGSLDTATHSILEQFRLLRVE